MGVIIIILIGLTIILSIIGIATNVHNSKSKNNPDIGEIKFSVNAINENIRSLEKELKGDLSAGRQETSQNIRDSRTEQGSQMQNFSKILTDTINLSSGDQKKLLDSFADQLKTFTESTELRLDKLKASIEEKMDSFQKGIEGNNRDSRKEQKDNLITFKLDLDNSWKDFKDQQRSNFSSLVESQSTQAKANTESLKLMHETMEKAIRSLQDGNEAKLEEMRKTVDEKLEKTLEARLTQSFTLVSERLETVHKGLGEMQLLAVGVGDLKKVLSNVRTRGVLGETQLANILEQMLSPEQYEVNVITKKGTNNRVEFAIRIPQQNQENKILLMPLDSKFPIEDYYALIAAYDRLDQTAIDAAGKTLESSIRKSAKDIHEKYVNPPDTSEIGLLFLPIEGLYAEVVRRPGLLETLQREYQIIITGPTTLAAILNTISFGYRTMAMEQRSGEIKKVLGAVRTEFNTFSTVLKRAQERINNVSEDIDLMVGVRTRKIQAKLRSFDEMPASEVAGLLSIENETEVIADLNEKNKEA